MNKLNLLVGISGSGKSFFARSFFEENPDKRIVISRDKIRNLLFAYNDSNVYEYYHRPDLRKREKQVSELHDRLIVDGLNQGKQILVDNTHLKIKYIEKYRYFGLPITLYIIPADLKLAIDRDNNRDRRVGEEVIRKQYQQYNNLITELSVKEQIEKKIQNKDFTPLKVKYNFRNPLEKRKYSKNKRDVIVVDIDGTLAHKYKDRNIFDYSQVYKDEVDKVVAEIVNNLYRDWDIIICSGREETSLPETQKWLENNNIPYLEIHMRKEGDYRPDYIVKEEMWKDIEKRWNIFAMIDDRRQVIDFARAKGYKVFDVANGTF